MTTNSYDAQTDPTFMISVTFDRDRGNSNNDKEKSHRDRINATEIA